MKVKINNHSALLVHTALSQPGWAAGIADIVLGGSLLVNQFGGLKPDFSDEARGLIKKSWLDTEIEYEFTDKEFAACQTALKKNAPMVLAPGAAASNVILIFNLA